MALRGLIKDTEFGVGDKVRVVQRIKDGDKFREATFEGMVIKMKGRVPGKTFTVRKIAEGGVGVERIFPFNMPSIDKIIVVKEGTKGVKRAKLYFTRDKAPTDVDVIYKRAAVRAAFKESAKSASMKSASKRKK